VIIFSGEARSFGEVASILNATLAINFIAAFF